jgi:hypothetical protein
MRVTVSSKDLDDPSSVVKMPCSVFTADRHLETGIYFAFCGVTKRFNGMGSV